MKPEKQDKTVWIKLRENIKYLIDKKWTQSY